MTEADVFIASDRALCAVVDQIRDDQWSPALPDWFQIGSSQDRSALDLRKIVNHHAYDDAWVPDVLAGKTAAEVGSAHDGDLLGADPKASFRAIAVKAIAAATGADLDKVVHLSYGDFPAREYFKHITSFRGFRAHDIAKLIGANSALPADLVHGMWDEIAPEVEGWRAMGVFGPAIPISADAPLQDRLLALCGRDPSRMPLQDR